MAKAQAKPIFRLLLTLCFIFSCFCFAGEQEPQYDNLSFGVPGRADTIIDRPGYALGYIEYHEQPAWVIYIMTKAEATIKAAKRTNKFRSDPEIPTGSATATDYRRSGYDRGHLAPAADMAFSGQTMADSFFMSNMSPQKPAFNRGIWKDLEALVRSFAITERKIVVVTGTLLPKKENGYDKLALIDESINNKFNCFSCGILLATYYNFS